MDLIEKINSIEKYVCEYFEDLDLDDPVEEGYFAEYEEVQGPLLRRFTILKVTSI